ncbi:MAG: ATP-binding protein [Actinomycetales bacterium]|nr:ATP-binding protein [Actinomycetales bacterium]
MTDPSPRNEIGRHLPPALSAIPPDPQADLVISNRPESVPRARAHVRSLLRRWGVHDHTVDDAELLVSELVTNSVHHARGPFITVRVTYDDSRVRCQVRDNDPTSPDEPHLPEHDQETGRGLYLVQAIATAWGTHLDSDGTVGYKVIWFDLVDPFQVTPLPRRTRRCSPPSPSSAAIPVDPALLHRVLAGLRRS